MGLQHSAVKFQMSGFELDLCEWSMDWNKVSNSFCEILSDHGACWIGSLAQHSYFGFVSIDVFHFAHLFGDKITECCRLDRERIHSCTCRLHISDNSNSSDGKCTDWCIDQCLIVPNMLVETCCKCWVAIDNSLLEGFGVQTQAWESYSSWISNARSKDLAMPCHTIACYAM